MTDAELLRALDYLRNTMIAVATGGPKIDSVNQEFQRAWAEVVAALKARGIYDAVPYGDLWDWYGRWSGGELPSYRSRREFVSEMFKPVIHRVRTGRVEEPEPTGWTRVDRTVFEAADRLASATVEEQFQAVGLLCREALISLAQAVYEASRYPTLDGVAASSTDARRMLEAFIAVELGGGANDEARKHARSALDLAVNLQHKRTAAFRDAALCVEATRAVVSIVAIVSGRRDPQ